MSERAAKTMTVPEVRERLYVLSDVLPELRALADQLWRRPPGRKKAPAVSRKLTPELKDEIRAYASAHPGETEHSVSIHFGVNQGRVSEALFGHRGDSD